MSAVEVLEKGYHYDPYQATWKEANAHHQKMIGAMEKSGTPRYGGNSRFVPAEVEEMRIRFNAEEFTIAELCFIHEVSETTIRNILSGASYKNVPGPTVEFKRRFTCEEVVSMRERYSRGGVLQAELAAETGMTQKMISKIVRGDAYARCGGPRTRAQRRAFFR